MNKQLIAGLLLCRLSTVLNAQANKADKAKLLLKAITWDIVFHQHHSEAFSRILNN